MKTPIQFAKIKPVADVHATAYADTEASGIAGLDFNTKNEDTDYQSGTSFHLEGTLSRIQI